MHGGWQRELIEWRAMSLSPPSQTRVVASLGSLYIVRMLGLFMVLPVLTLAGDEYGAEDLTLLGIALGIYGLTQACLQIPFGLLSDRFGRKPLLIIGLLIFLAGSIIAATAETVTGLIIGRALQGAGAVAGVIMAMVADLTTDNNRTKAMAAIGASIGIAFALSLVIGPLLASMGGIRLIFIVTAGLAVIGLLIVLFAIPKVATNASLLSIGSLKTIIADTHLLRLNAGVFILHAILTALFIVFPLLLVGAGVGSEYHSWVYLLAMALAFVVMVPLMIIGEKRNQVRRVFAMCSSPKNSRIVIGQLSTYRPYYWFYATTFSVGICFLLGKCIPLTSNNQIPNPTAATANKTTTPPTAINQPPAMPPTAAPRNWQVENTPEPAPRYSSGTALLINDGSVASR